MLTCFQTLNPTQTTRIGKKFEMLQSNEITTYYTIPEASIHKFLS